MKKLVCGICICLLLVFLPFAVLAKQWPAIGLTGGGSALDGIDTTSGVNDGDVCHVYNDTGTVGWYLWYHFISGDSTGESVPLVIAPNTGSGRWHLSKTCYKQVTFVLEGPGSAENFASFRMEHAGTIFKVVGVLQGSATPSVTIQPKHGSDRSAAGTSLFSAAQAVTSITTGDVDVTGWNDNTFVADDWLWMTTTAQSGTVNEISVTIFFAYH